MNEYRKRRFYEIMNRQNNYRMNHRWLMVIGLSFIICHLSFSSATAQIRFGHLSYDAAFRAMPEYVIMQKNLQNLKAQYDAELKRAEEEFNTKYEAFLEVQRDLAPAIRLKRQAELQELMEKNLAFRDEAKGLLEAAHRDAETPLRQKLSDLLAAIGQERGYAFILNTDNDACPYIDPTLGEDILPMVISRLK